MKEKCNKVKALHLLDKEERQKALKELKYNLITINHANQMSSLDYGK